MKDPIEMYAEAISKTVLKDRTLTENMKTLAEESMYEFNLSYDNTKVAVLSMNMELGSKGRVDSQTFEIRSASDAAKAYASFYQKHKGESEAGVYGCIGFGSDKNSAEEIAKELPFEHGINYVHMTNTKILKEHIVLSISMDHTSPADAKKYIDGFFKRFDPLFKALAEKDKVIQSKDPVKILKFFEKYEKEEAKLQKDKAIEIYLDLFERDESFYLETNKVSKEADIETALGYVEIYSMD